MRVFTCGNSFEDKMTCIYDAWEYALLHGHNNVRLMLEPVCQYSFAEEYVHVDADIEKTNKVVRSIINSISYEAYLNVFYSTLFYEDTLDDIYRFLIVAFKVGSGVTRMLTDKAVMRIMEYRRKVGNEIHFSHEFIRFNSIDNKVYVAHYEPKCDIIYLTAMHFADRMPSEHFVIIDDNRQYAVVHPANEDMHITELTDEYMLKLRETEYVNDDYRVLWKEFFNSIGIKERENYKCQRNMFPKWMRKHAVEFLD